MYILENLPSFIHLNLCFYCTYIKFKQFCTKSRAQRELRNAPKLKKRFCTGASLNKQKTQVDRQVQTLFQNQNSVNYLQRKKHTELLLVSVPLNSMRSCITQSIQPVAAECRVVEVQRWNTMHAKLSLDSLWDGRKLLESLTILFISCYILTKVFLSLSLIFYLKFRSEGKQTRHGKF